MSTSINTNISALAAQSSLRKTGLDQSTSMERLSTGIRINSARDDAAGLAISTRMTANIRGISAAIRNANDGISLTQTAEGSLTAIGDNLQRIRELAVQSANTGNNSSDRSALNAEAVQLIAEIDRVANNSAFNGIKLLDGSFKNQDLQVGAGNDANDRITVSITNAKASALGVGSGSSYSSSKSGVTVSAALTSGSIALNGVSVGASTADGVSFSESTASGISIASAINAVSGSSGVSATVSATKSNTVMTGTAITVANVALADGDIKINGTSIGAIAAEGANLAADIALRGGKVAAAINAITSKTGVSATYAASSGITLTAIDDRNIEVITGAAAGYAANTGIGAAIAAGTVTQKAGTTVTTFNTDLDAGAVLINGVDIGAIKAAGSAGERGGQMAAAINAKSSQTGVTASFNATTGAVVLGAADGRNITVKTSSAATALKTGLSSGGDTTAITRSYITLSSASKDGIMVSDISGVGANAAGLKVGLTDATATAGAGVSSLDLSTVSGSQAALSTLDKAIDTITNARASMGAYQNRLTASISNLETTSMNLQASRSRILDTDYAKETTNLAKSQIITQAATAMLAQANQSAQSVLALLK